MSEDRAKRDGDTSGSVDPEGVDATGSARSVAPTGKPSGKRRGRATGANSDDGAGARGKVTVADSRSARTKTADGKTAGNGKAAKKKKSADRKENIFKRLVRFFREVVAELRKVIWPNRKQMVTYTTVVLVFVAFMVAFIGLLDLGVIKGVTWLFG
ncbi:preprotein translocase subunit SecE [Rhodococcus sp. HNM0569]|uniref:preprotein translocase subunit SecE n=1 Tax=Rhodococcus sp. HNM0569 TaxID=2716340 RepID=UPI00146D52C7|nr:preprotein translocase subunit SecE [Rhodococcus sp. HNM0569]